VIKIKTICDKQAVQSYIMYRNIRTGLIHAGLTTAKLRHAGKPGGATMTEYLVLWLSVLVFIMIGILTNVMFFRARSKKTGRRNNLDSMLFEADHRP
jgi:hypothetical protein